MILPHVVVDVATVHDATITNRSMTQYTAIKLNPNISMESMILMIDEFS